MARIYQGETSSLSSAIISSNNDDISDDNNDDNMNSPTTLSFQILLDQLKLARDENRSLQNEIENLKEKLMEKNGTIVDTENFVFHLPRVVFNQSNEGDEQQQQQQQQKQHEQDEAKKEKELEKKKKIKKLSKFLGLSYIQLKKCRQKRITITCSQVIVTTNWLSS
ncbi:hypothetical protein I4U23_005743 [Adineta vaga]|nr:hypothetical protein I4U23_005743 [Adineta vaga]